jgi:hypothetical protein
MGTSACSPEMRRLMEEEFDPRFVFSEWNQPLMDALLKQQETLKIQGHNRQVVVLVDDIVLSGRDEEALAHLCLRGRHFNISVLACAVSYTTLPKRSRRSLDVLFLFSCPMAGDCKILTQEYSNQARMARYCLQNLPEWTSLVLETLERRQRMYHYRVFLESSQSEALSPCTHEKTEASPDLPEHNQTVPHSNETDDLLHGTSTLETSEPPASE